MCTDEYKCVCYEATWDVDHFVMLLKMIAIVPVIFLANYDAESLSS